MVGKFLLGMVSGGLLVTGGLVVGSMLFPIQPANDNRAVAPVEEKIEAPAATVADAGDAVAKPEENAPEAAAPAAEPEAEPAPEPEAAEPEAAEPVAAETVAPETVASETVAPETEAPETAPATDTAEPAVEPTATAEPAAEVASAEPAQPKVAEAPPEPQALTTESTTAEAAAPEAGQVAAPETAAEPSKPAAATADVAAAAPEPAPTPEPVAAPEPASDTASADPAPEAPAPDVAEGEAAPAETIQADATATEPAPDATTATEVATVEPEATPAPADPSVAEPAPAEAAAPVTEPVAEAPTENAPTESAPTETDIADLVPEPAPEPLPAPDTEAPATEAPATEAPAVESGDAMPAAPEVEVAEAAPEAVDPDVAAPDVAAPDATAPDMPGTKPGALPEVAAEQITPDAPLPEGSSSTFKPAPGLPRAGEGVIIGRGTETTEPAPTDPAALPADTRPIAAFATPFENPDAKPAFAIVLIDDGRADLDRAGLANLPIPATIALDPLDPASPERAAAYRAAGKEVVMLVTGIAQGAQASDVEVAFQSMAQGLPEAVAAMDLATPAFQNNRGLSSAVVPILKAQGRGLLTWDEGLNAADQVARREDLEAATVFRDIGTAGADPVAMRRLLDRAVFKAGQEGRVAVVGTADAGTLAALLEWTVEGKAATVALAPLTAVLKVD